MVARTLVDRDIQAGRLLLEELKKQKTDIRAALWFYVDEDDQWLLLLASPVVDEQGPLAAYTLVQNALKNIPENMRPEFTDISVVSPSDDRIRAIGATLKTGPGISEIRFRRNVVNNLYIEDALVYRSN
jgi:hypothetical protein